MKLQSLLAEYGESHQNKTNILIHKICVPAITFSVIGLLSAIPFSPLNIPLVLWILAGVLVYYISLSFKYFLLFLPMALSFLILSYYLGSIGLAWQVSLVVFVVSWILQFYGHAVEGKKPSFLKDLQFLLIGPLWTIKTILKLKD